MEKKKNFFLIMRIVIISSKSFMKCALQQDQNLIFFVDSLLTHPSNSPLLPLLIKEPVTQDEIREHRIQYFDNQSATPVDVNDDNKIIRVNRMKVR